MSHHHHTALQHRINKISMVHALYVYLRHFVGRDVFGLHGTTYRQDSGDILVGGGQLERSLVGYVIVGGRGLWVEWQTI